MNFFSRIHLALIAQLCFIAPLSTHAQFVQQGNKLVGIGAVGTVHQGQSVAISADGNTAIVGGNGDNNTAGATWVFTRSGGVWTQQGNKLVGTGAVNVARQGLSVAISADGNTTVVGGPLDNYDTANYSYRGATWVFTRTNGIWTQQGNKLVGTGAVGGAYQGRSVAISADGNTAIVGGNDDNNNAGATWVFTRSGGVWTQQGSKLVGTDAIGLANQGWSGSLSADGNTAIVGGFGDNDGVGAVWVFTRSAGVWTEQGSKLVGTGAVSTARQGYSVSISSDGNTALVGGYYDNNYTGAIWVFTRTGGVWTQQGSKLVGTGAVGVHIKAPPSQFPLTAIRPSWVVTTLLELFGYLHERVEFGRSWEASWSARAQSGVHIKAPLSQFPLTAIRPSAGGRVIMGVLEQLGFFHARRFQSYFRQPNPSFNV